MHGLDTNFVPASQFVCVCVCVSRAEAPATKQAGVAAGWPIHIAPALVLGARVR